jgi:hypothetical protein
VTNTWGVIACLPRSPKLRPQLKGSTKARAMPKEETRTRTRDKGSRSSTVSSMGKKKDMSPVVEPPELYGPHVPIIAFQTSNTTHVSQTTPVVYWVSSMKPKSSTFYNSYRINKGVVTTLQHLI